MVRDTRGGWGASLKGLRLPAGPQRLFWSMTLNSAAQMIRSLLTADLGTDHEFWFSEPLDGVCCLQLPVIIHPDVAGEVVNGVKRINTSGVVYLWTRFAGCESWIPCGLHTNGIFSAVWPWARHLTSLGHFCSKLIKKQPLCSHFEWLCTEWGWDWKQTGKILFGPSSAFLVPYVIIQLNVEKIDTFMP